jgi:acetolactate synthase small subunit
MDASTRSVVFETLGASDKIESFVADMVEISRTEIVAVARGREAT